MNSQSHSENDKGPQHSPAIPASQRMTSSPLQPQARASPPEAPAIVASPVTTFLKRLFVPSEHETESTSHNKIPAHGSAKAQSPLRLPTTREEHRSGAAPPAQPPRQHRLKVAVVGEAESGRTSLCRSLEHAADGRTHHPLVVSGPSAALKMDSSVFSVNSFDVPLRQLGAESARQGATPPTPRDTVLEVAITDSGPAPLTYGAGVQAVMEADVILLCFPLYGIKQVIAQPSSRAFGMFGASKPTEAFVHSRDCQLLTTLLTLLSSRCRAQKAEEGVEAGAAAAGPLVVLVGTFHDTLKDASPEATHTILRALQRLCNRAGGLSPSMLRVADVVAVSTTQATCVSLGSATHTPLSLWWRRLLDWAVQRTVVSDAAPPNPERAAVPQPLPSAATAAPPDALRHLLAHPSPLSTLHAGVRQLVGHGSPPCLENRHGTSRLSSATCQEAEVATRHIGADARVTSLVIDFIAQLKARGRVWMLPLPKLWRVAFALGMQTREQLYLVLRQMEATGEVLLLGRALQYATESQMGGCGPTNESVSLCPALVRASLSIVFVYADWAAHRQRRHVTKCLRSVDLDECRACDPTEMAARGVFPWPLLRCLAAALRLKGHSAEDACQLLVAALVGMDVAYVVDGVGEQNTSVSPKARDGPLSALRSSLPFSLSHGLLASPTRAEHHSRSNSSNAADSPSVSTTSSGRGGFPRKPHFFPSTETLSGAVSPTHSVEGEMTVSAEPKLPSHSAKVDSKGRDDAADFAPNITVAELTSLFLLGELTASMPSSVTAATSAAPAPAASTSPLLSPRSTSRPKALIDALGAAVQRVTSPAAPLEPGLLAEKRSAFLVVPVLQPIPSCPAPVVRCVNAHYRAHRPRAARRGRGGVVASRIALRVDPLPYDLAALLTCRFASVAQAVDAAYANAALFSVAVAPLLQPTTDHTPLFQRRGGGPAAVAADSCFFFWCAPSTGEKAAASATLELVCFAHSLTRLRFLELSLWGELRSFFEQRLPGVALALMATPPEDERETKGEESPSCVGVSTVQEIVGAICSAH